MFRYLTQEDVRQALLGQDLVALMEEALRSFSAGEVVQPVRTAMSVGPGRAVFGFMPAYLHACPALGSKLLTVFNSNQQRGLPTHFAVILLFDPDTGELVAFMDGSYITEVRTAAVSAAAVRHLAARPIRRLGLFGCGVQARSHLRAIAAVAPELEEARIWGPAGDRGPFVNEMRRVVAFPLLETTSDESAAGGADLIILVTSSPVPVVRRSWIQPGALVISVGACRRDQREMDPLLVQECRLFVDSRAAALEESGDILQGIAEGRFTAEHIRGELGEVIRGSIAARESADEIVVFKSLGLAVEDIATAVIACRQAVAGNIGKVLSL